VKNSSEFSRASENELDERELAGELQRCSNSWDVRLPACRMPLERLFQGRIQALILEC